MPRIRETTFDGYTYRIAPLSFDEAQKFLEEGKEILAKKDEMTNEDWVNRTIDYVVFTLNKATPSTNGDKWTRDKVRSEMDMILINKIFSDFLTMSGLKLEDTSKSGEATAASILN